MLQQKVCATYDMYLNASFLVTVHKVNVIEGGVVAIHLSFPELLNNFYEI
jgi:hypothetical protein